MTADVHEPLEAPAATVGTTPATASRSRRNARCMTSAFADYEKRRYADIRAVVASFAPWLRDGLDVDRATEVLWAVLDHTTGDNLMRVRGWTVPQFADFVVETAERLLLE